MPSTQVREVLWPDGHAGLAVLAHQIRTEIEQAYAAAKTRLNVDQIAIFLALGGGWQTAAPPAQVALGPTATSQTP